MINSVKKRFIFSFAICFLLINCLQAERKNATEVFRKWFDIQQVFDVVDLTAHSNSLDKENLLYLKDQENITLDFLTTIGLYFNFFSNQQISNVWDTKSNLSEEKIVSNFKNLYKLFNSDIQGLVEYLKKQNFGTEKSTDVKGAVSYVEEYKNLAQVLFFNKDPLVTENLLFTVGNKLFDYCFNTKTWPNFKSMLLDETQHEIAKFLYSVMWWNLAGSGWKNWSAQSLKYLKQRADDGCEVIYIAGGSDIYQLIKHGIYNIKIIDPLLPSQPKYYSEGWDWLIKGGAVREDPSTSSQLRHVGATASATAAGFDGQAGRTAGGTFETSEEYGIGDEIEFDFSDSSPVRPDPSTRLGCADVSKGKSEFKKIIMKRESFKPSGQKFQARIVTGQMIDIQRSETVWGIYDLKLGKRLGSFKIERRFANQNDFTNDKKKAMLISFNELYFIAAPPSKGGWGINPYKFFDNMFINVKQLHKPVSSKIVRNMRSAFEQMEFNYIALGTCVD